MFVQDQITLGNWTFIPGMRLETFDITTSEGADVTGSEFLPKFTAAYNFDNGVELYASYAKGMRSPRLNELQVDATSRGRRGTTVTLANPDLEAETSEAYEIGARFTGYDLISSGDRLGFGIAAYRNDFSNRIEDVTLSVVGNTTTRQLQNVGSAYTQGLELTVDYEADRVFMGLVAETSKGENNETGEELNSVRPNKGTLYAGLKWMDERLRLGAEYEYFSGKTEVGQNQGVIGDSSDAGELVNLFGGYQVNEQLSVNARVNNIFDEAHRRFDQIDEGMGLNAKLDVQYTF